MTCQVQLKQKIKNLEFVLPNPNVTLQNSMKFTELVTLAAVSSISHLRNIFPETAFDPLKINGKPVWLLKGSKDIPGTLTLIRWMKGAMDAVREHILKKMILVIEKQNERKTLETYTFNFAYNVDAINVELSSKTTGGEPLVESMDSKVQPENIRKAIQDLMCRMLVLTENMEPLPTDCEVGVRLEFYDNVPETYKLPAIFTAVESLNIKFPCDIHSLKLGDVESKFIGIALRAKSVTNKIVNEVLKPMEEAREDFSFDVHDFFHTNQDDILDEVQPSQEEPTALYNCSIKTPTTAPSEMGDEATNVAETMSTISLKENEVKCICECNNSSNALINCQSCQTFQHKACYKLLDDDKISQHVCVDCHESTDMICIDPSLVSKENRKFEALYRRALVICLNRSRVSSKTFVDQLDLTRQNAQNIFNQLNTDGFLHHTTGKGLIRTVKKEYLRENAFTKYFTTSSVTNEESQETQVNLALQDSNNGSVTSLKRPSTQVDEYCQRKRLKYATNQGQTNIQLYS